MSILRGYPQRRPTRSASRALAARPVSARQVASRRGLTLTELLVTIGLLAFLASIALVGLWEAQEVARESRAQSQVARIDAMLMERWDDYAHRGVQMNMPLPPAGANGERVAKAQAAYRTKALRALARVEMPDRILDVVQADMVTPPTLTLNDSGLTPALPHPSLYTTYVRLLAYDTNWSVRYQGAECLYAILATMTKGEQNGLDFFKPSEIGDVDGDGRPEILDPWGVPIEFIRWAPGLQSRLHTRQETQTIATYGAPDAGDFRLYLGTTSNLTGTIAFDATANQVESAISGAASSNGTPLDTDPSNGPAVTGPPGGPWVVRFERDVNPTLFGIDPGAMTLSGTTLPGGFASVRVTTDFIDPLDPGEALGGGPPLHPLVVSAGRDGKYGIYGLADPDVLDADLPTVLPVVNYDTTPSRQDPYASSGTSPVRLLGEPYTLGATSGPQSDNITNHSADAG